MAKNKENIIITGGSGYLGSHVSKKLTSLGFNITNIDISPPISHIPNVKFVRGNILNIDDLNSACTNDVFAIIHLAAKCSVRESILTPNTYFETNSQGTKNVLSICKHKSIKNLLFASSSAVYCPSNITPVQEHFETNPINPYGRSKLDAEKLIELATQESSINAISFRFFNICGQNPEVKAPLHQSRIFNAICSSILNKKILLVNSAQFAGKDSSCTRDYVHIDDASESIIRGLLYLKSESATQKKHLILNCGSGQGYSTLEIISKFEEEFGEKIRFEIIPAIDENPTLIANITAMAQTLDFTPQFSQISTIIKGIHAKLKTF